MKPLKNQNGFASFEFAWCSLIFAALLMSFFYFFKIFYTSHLTLLHARNQAFSAVWQSSTLLDEEDSSFTAKGLIDKYEVIASAFGGYCAEGSSGSDECKKYTRMGSEFGYAQNYGLGISYYDPVQSVYLILEDLPK